MNWPIIGILYAIALVCCAIGFKRFVWFLSIGYGYAVAGIALGCLVLGAVYGLLDPGLIVALAVAAAYGIRLGTFLLKRETGNKAYKKILDNKVGAEPPIFVKLFAWFFVAALYICETAGLIFRMTNRVGTDVFLILGVLIMAAGASIEALSDKQKSAQKAARPDMVATQGLFKMVRCPNYFGEITFWTGVLISGIPAFRGVLPWVLALIGYVAIVYIMFDGAKRLEKGHMERYGRKGEYCKYAETTPILIPLIPLYHLYDPAKDRKKEQKK